MAIIVPRRREDFFQANGDPTLRFIRFLEGLTDQSNKTDSDVEQLPFTSDLSSSLQQTIKRLDGLPEFTIDTSGFTTDLTFITTDKVIA